jgi:transposase
MTEKEEVLDIQLLHKQGLSARHIARRLGLDRRTVRKYVEKPEEAGQCKRRAPVSCLLDEYQDSINAFLSDDPEYSAQWIWEQLRKQGFTGSYELVKVRVRGLKGERQRLAYVRFETEPGYQAQVDFGEFAVEFPDGTVKKYYLFSMILGYSRMLYVELVERCDLVAFLDCHIHAFEYFGGVVQEVLYDRMKNVFIRKLAGKAQFNDALVSLALHYGFKPIVAPAYAAWVKGKVERPYSFVREGFWRGYGFTSLERTNQDLLSWLRVKAERIHGTTQEKVVERFGREKPHLGALPPVGFDTAWRVYRPVHKDCTVRFECNSYVVPHTLVGRRLVLRVKEETMRIYDGDTLVVTYAIPEGKGHLVQDPRFYEALRRDRAMNARKYGIQRKQKARAKATISPLKPQYEVIVQRRPLNEYMSLLGEGVAA